MNTLTRCYCLRAKQQKCKKQDFFIKCFWLFPGNRSLIGTWFNKLTPKVLVLMSFQKIWKIISCYLHVRWPSRPSDAMTKIHRSFRCIEPTIPSCLYELEQPVVGALEVIVSFYSLLLLGAGLMHWQRFEVFLHLTYLILEGVIALFIIDVIDKSLTPSFSCSNGGVR